MPAASGAPGVHQPPAHPARLQSSRHRRRPPVTLTGWDAGPVPTRRDTGSRPTTTSSPPRRRHPGRRTGPDRGRARYRRATNWPSPTAATCPSSWPSTDSSSPWPATPAVTRIPNSPGGAPAALPRHLGRLIHPTVRRWRDHGTALEFFLHYHSHQQHQYPDRRARRLRRPCPGHPSAGNQPPAVDDHHPARSRAPPAMFTPRRRRSLGEVAAEVDPAAPDALSRIAKPGRRCGGRERRR